MSTFARATSPKRWKLCGQPGFQVNATHLELAYRVHHILAAAGKGEAVITCDADLGAVRRFVDEVFFATQLLAEDLHAEAKERANRPDAAPGWPATGGLSGSETTDRVNDIGGSNSGAGELANAQTAITRPARTRHTAGPVVLNAVPRVDDPQGGQLPAGRTKAPQSRRQEIAPLLSPPLRP